MFGRNRHDRLFARFASGGDVAALGEVFDATAPELLRIAAHLSGSRERARDLVQQAFLLAIEKRSEFAKEGRVLPWLCGIVVNLARNARRREQRELTAPERAGTEDPVAAAEAAEFRAALAQAKNELSDVYRPVLDLHLEHGLSAVEIGNALGRPAGTVRTQLVRALELLRRRLPQGFVAGLAVVTFDAATLRAMRTVVVQRGAEVTPVAVASGGAALTFAVIGAGAMQKKLAIVGGIAVLFALGLWIATALPGAADDAHEARRDAAVLAVSAPSGSDSGGSGAPAPAAAVRAVAPVRDAVPSVAAAPSGSLEVLVRWRSDDAPAIAQAITVAPADAMGELGARDAVTDAGGRAVFAALQPGAVLVQASTGVRHDAIIVAGERATVSLVLEGVAVHGTVVDHRGEPVAGADVWVSSEVVYTRVRPNEVTPWGQYGQRTLRTDDQGHFATRLMTRQSVAAFKEGHGPSLTQYPVVGKGRNPRGPIEVVLTLLPAGGTLSVVVRGKDAAPLPGALVLAGQEVPSLTGLEEPRRATTPALRVVTDGSGAATLAPLPTGRIPVQVRAAGYGPWIGEIDVAAGVTTPLDIELIDGGIVTGVVVDATGKPLRGALVHHGAVSALASSFTLTDTNGAYRLEHLPAGELALAAFHEEWGRVATKLTVVAGETARWDARMPSRGAITGRVLDADGTPAGGCYVTAYGGDRGRNATTTTDAAGAFTLTPLDPDGRYSVTAEVALTSGGFAHPQRDSVPAGTHVELRVAADQVPTARLRGRVLQWDGKPAVGYEVDASTVGEGIGSRHPIAADGTFELGPSTARRVHVSLYRANTHRGALADFGVHEMRDRETTDVGDLVIPMPGGVRIRIAGTDADRSVAALFRDGRFVDERRFTGEPLLWPELAPGAYAACVLRGGASPLCGLTEFTVEPGRAADVTVAVAPATVREVGLGRRPRPPSEAKAPPGTTMVGGAEFVLRANDAGGRSVMLMRAMPDPDGSATRVVLPDTAVTLSALGGDGRRGSVSTVTSPGEPIVIPLARQ